MGTGIPTMNRISRDQQGAPERCCGREGTRSRCRMITASRLSVSPSFTQLSPCQGGDRGTEQRLFVSRRGTHLAERYLCSACSNQSPIKTKSSEYSDDLTDVGAARSCQHRQG